MGKPKLFRMPLVCLGTHQAPQQEVGVSTDRARHWIESHRRITAEGNRVPMPWGHQLKAIPHNDADARRFAMARWNAGNVIDLEYNPETKWVDAIATVPPGYEVETDASGKPTGRLVNPTDHTTIQEMSAGIGNWRDGKGKVWRDIIVHAALCTLPVIAGQSGVTAALATDWDAYDPDVIYTATMDTDGVEYLYTLSSRSAIMPGKDDDMTGKGDKEPIPDLDLDDLAPIPDMPAPTPVPSAGTDQQCATDIMNYASAVGIPIPQDTTPQNLLERIRSTLATLAAIGWKMQGPQANGGQPESKVDASMDGAQPEMAGPGTTFMSTEPDKTITLSAEAIPYVEAVAQERREAYGRRWQELENKGHIRPEIGRRERDYLPRFKPAIDPITCRVSLPEAKERLDLVMNAIGGRVATVRELTTPAAHSTPTAEPVTLSTAEPETNPARRNTEGDATKRRDLLEYMAKEANLSLVS